MAQLRGVCKYLDARGLWRSEVASVRVGEVVPVGGDAAFQK